MKSTSIRALSAMETVYISELSSIKNEQLFTKHIYVGTTRLASKLGNLGYGSIDLEYEKRNTYYTHGDHLGSATLITDHRGEEYRRYISSPYGETFVKQGDELGKIDYSFTGQRENESTGLIAFPARYYDPKVSRWLSVDPILGSYLDSHTSPRKLPGLGGMFNPTNMHLYHYANNNPIKYYDPSGESALCATWSGTMWWLVPADTVLPIGDAIYVSGILITGGVDIFINYGHMLPELIDRAGYYMNEVTEKGEAAVDKIETNISNSNMPDPNDPNNLTKVTERLKQLYENKPMQDHHWINQATLTGKNPHKISQIAKKLGVDIKKVDWNISRIPHQGGHKTEYYKYIKEQLDFVYKAYEKSGGSWNKTQMEAALKQVVNNIQKAVASGEINLYR